jgi:predicted metal-dependent hydrolase
MKLDPANSRGERPPSPADRADRVDPVAEALFVRHRRARRYVLRLTTDGRPRVTIPRGGSKRGASEFLAGQADWIARERSRQVAQHEAAARPWTSGARVWLRGVLTTVQAIEADGERRVALGPDTFSLRDEDDVRGAVERHLRTLAVAELPTRLRSLAARHGLSVSRVTVRDQRTRWGSCAPGGTVSLNWRLVQMPDSVRDYILIHELMHLREANHSRRFWRLVNDACPWHLEARRWLRRHGHDLHRPLAGSPETDIGAVAPQGVEDRWRPSRP